MQTLTTFLDWVRTNHTALLALVFGAAGLSVTLEVALTKFKVQSKKVGFTLLHVFSALSGLAALPLGASDKTAGGIYVGLLTVAGVWHRFVVSDANTKYVTPFLTWLSNQKTPTPATATAPVTGAASTVMTTGSIAGGTSNVTLVGSTAGDAKPFTLDQPGK